MKAMNKTLFFLVLILVAVACNKPVDKKFELAKLKKEHDELSVKIKTLETELKVSDTTSRSKENSFSVT